MSTASASRHRRGTRLSPAARPPSIRRFTRPPRLTTEVSPGQCHHPSSQALGSPSSLPLGGLSPAQPSQGGITTPGTGRRGTRPPPPKPYGPAEPAQALPSAPRPHFLPCPASVSFLCNTEQRPWGAPGHRPGALCLSLALPYQKGCSPRPVHPAELGGCQQGPPYRLMELLPPLQSQQWDAARLLRAPYSLCPAPCPAQSQTCQGALPQEAGPSTESRARLIPVQAPPAIWLSPCLSPAALVQSHQREEDTNVPGAPRAPPAPSPSCPRG